MKKPIPVITLLMCALALLPGNHKTHAQQDLPQKIVESYTDYVSDTREVIYLHLNKSTFIKGESIGFTAYVLDKKSKKPSALTTNLYVSLEDDKGKLLEQMLLKVENGIASNVIDLDERFSSGYYTIKAYTNWMRNFNEPNYFVETVRILDPEQDTYIEAEFVQNSIDAQFLPEGGHILNGVVNNIGVVLKDTKGYGVPEIKGTVSDQKGNVITEFQVNKLGIGRFPLLAEIGKQYTVNLSYKNKDYSFKMGSKVERIGVTLSLVNHRNKAIVALMTNKESLEAIKGKSYHLTVHNGGSIKAVDISFDEQTNIVKAFDLAQLPSGVNVVTLFNEKNQPVIERLFFNYNGIDIKRSSSITASRSQDSVAVKLDFKGIDPQSFNNISVSVLPQETDSYNRHHNLLSYTFLKPYINGTIENAKYYFEDITEEKKLELDNLLLTQGWSSYDWNEIFTNERTRTFPFEQGITIKANINPGNKLEDKMYMVHQVGVTDPMIVSVPKEEKNFTVDMLFPYRENKLYLSEMTKKKGVLKPNLYVQIFPRSIPKLNSPTNVMKPKEKYSIASDITPDVLVETELDKTQALEEVVLTTKLDKQKMRLQELSKTNYGRITIMDDKTIKQHMFLSNFLSNKGFKVTVNYRGGYIQVEYYGGKILKKPPPAIFLNGSRLNDYSQLFKLPLEYIDYIAIDRFRKYNRNEGAISIFLYPGSRKEDNKIRKLALEFPLKFKSNKKFYVPRYQNTYDDFYKGYGVVDWKPNVTINSNGVASFKIAEPSTPIKLFIEGATMNGTFIYEEKAISLN